MPLAIDILLNPHSKVKSVKVRFLKSTCTYVVARSAYSNFYYINAVIESLTETLCGLTPYTNTIPSPVVVP